MMKVTKYVKASTIWANAKDYVDEGLCRGLVRGYNVEIQTKEGKIDWLSCNWIEGTIEEYLDDEFTKWRFTEHGWKFTGRVCFRGYGEEEWDPVERDTYIVNIGPKKRTDDIPDSEFEFLRRSKV